jgi:arabinose-5-phosphate isomerase
MSNQLSKRLLLDQKDEIDYIINNINYDKIDELINLFKDHPETNIFFTGVGKSNNIAKHYADLFKSIGYPAFTLSILDSTHGDMGCMRKGNILVIFSKSGNTIEIIDKMPYLKKKELYIIGIFCNEKSLISNDCNKTIIIPCRKELDNNYNLVPSTSVISFIVLCNILIAGILHSKNITKEEYGMNHPAGTIGKRIWLNVKDVMISLNEIPFVKSDTKLVDILLEMTEKKTGCVLVSDDQKKLIGIITDGDIRRYLINNSIEQNNIMNEIAGTITNNDSVIVNENDNLYNIYDNIKKNNKLLSGIPVLNNHKEIVGLLSRNTIINSGII